MAKKTKAKSAAKTRSTTKAKATKKTAKKQAGSAAPAIKRVTGGRRIGVFGGTFNPIHFGHMNSMETVKEALKLDELWIVPNCQNPLREKIEGPTPEERLEMVRLAVEGLNQSTSGFVVRDDEVRRGGASYTVDTLTQFMKEQKDAEFFLILGADQIEGFASWKDYKKILKMVNLVFTTRPGAELPGEKTEAPKWLQDELTSLRGKKVKLKSGGSLQMVYLRDVQVSGTEIRRKSRTGGAISHLTPPPVAKFIETHRVYSRAGALIRDYAEFTRYCGRALAEKGGLQIEAYDVSELVQPSEFTIVCSGTSTRHTRALAEHIMKDAKDKYGVYPQATEGLQEGRWVVLDYGTLMIHVFYDFVRNEYRIENLWREGEKLGL